MTVDEKQLIRDALISYILTNYVCNFDHTTIPLDESLVELGVLDSYGIVELVDFIENTWSTNINNGEITREKMGSINKMVNLIKIKTSPK